MNENLNLVEILKDVPRGTELWTPLFGKVCFVGINEEDQEYPITVMDAVHIDHDFRTNGRWSHIEDSEVVLFPAKDQRDWSKFVLPVEKPKKRVTLHPFDRVLLRDSNEHWHALFLSYKACYERGFQFVSTGGTAYEYCIPYNADTAPLLGTTDPCPIDYEITFDKSYI